MSAPAVNAYSKRSADARYYTRSEVDAIVAGIPVPDTSGLMPKAGGAFTGPVSFGAGATFGDEVFAPTVRTFGPYGLIRLDARYGNALESYGSAPITIHQQSGNGVVIGGDVRPAGAPTGNATVVANQLAAMAGAVVTGDALVTNRLRIGTTGSPDRPIYVKGPTAVSTFTGIPSATVTDESTVSLHAFLRTTEAQVRSNVALGFAAGGSATSHLQIAADGSTTFYGPLAATQGATVTGGLTAGNLTLGIYGLGNADLNYGLSRAGLTLGTYGGQGVPILFYPADTNGYGGAADTRLRRTAANTLTLDDAAGGPANLALPFEGQLRFGDANHYIKTTGGYGTTYYDTNGHHFAGGPVSMTNPAFTTDLGDCTATARCNAFANDGVAFRAMRGNDPLGRLYFAGDTGAGQHTYLDCNGGALTLRGGDGTGAAGLTAGRITHALAASAPSLLPGQSQAWADAAAHAYTIDWVEADTTLRRKALVSDV
ncbi:MAG: hypothetical protein JWO31_3277 [Phycisphaerales bacterium]|nr:hypothetical protein [Phycisphaerales bacterium]